MIRAPLRLHLRAGSPVLADLLIDHFGGVAVQLDGPGQVLTRHGGYLEILRQRVADAPCRLLVRVYNDVHVVAQSLDLDNVVILPCRGLVLEVVDMVRIGVQISSAGLRESMLDWGRREKGEKGEKGEKEERAGWGRLGQRGLLTRKIFDLMLLIHESTPQKFTGLFIIFFNSCTMSGHYSAVQFISGAIFCDS